MIMSLSPPSARLEKCAEKHASFGLELVAEQCECVPIAQHTPNGIGHSFFDSETPFQTHDDNGGGQS
jgi:hypothetical protein